MDRKGAGSTVDNLPGHIGPTMILPRMRWSGTIIWSWAHGAVVAQETHNLLVAGSNPAGPTRMIAFELFGSRVGEFFFGYSQDLTDWSEKTRDRHSRV